MLGLLLLGVGASEPHMVAKKVKTAATTKSSSDNNSVAKNFNDGSTAVAADELNAKINIGVESIKKYGAKFPTAVKPLAEEFITQTVKYYTSSMMKGAAQKAAEAKVLTLENRTLELTQQIQDINATLSELRVKFEEDRKKWNEEKADLEQRLHDATNLSGAVSGGGLPNDDDDDASSKASTTDGNGLPSDED